MSAHAFEVALASLGVNGPEDVTPTWDAVRWRAHEDNVRRLRQRIFKATQDGDLARVRNLQKRNTPASLLGLAWAVCVGMRMHGPEGALAQQCARATWR
jgi:hypothetical protein